MVVREDHVGHVFGTDSVPSKRFEDGCGPRHQTGVDDNDGFAVSNEGDSGGHPMIGAVQVALEQDMDLSHLLRIELRHGKSSVGGGWGRSVGDGHLGGLRWPRR
jgi:hypothetical protein